MPEVEIIRKSPIVIVRNFIAVQFAASALYFLAGAVAYYARIWQGLPLAHLVSFQVAQVVFVFVIEVGLILYIFLMWWRHHVRLTDDQVQDNQGVLFRRHLVVARAKIASVTFTQGLLGRLTNYGTVLLHDAQGLVLLRLVGMYNPQEFVKKIIVQGKPSEGGIPVGEPNQLVLAEENEQVERKSTFRWDLATGKVNRQLEHAALKTIAAFLNGQGGHLILGVGDDHQAVGLQHDLATLGRKDVDGLVNHFGNVFNTMLGGHLRHLVHLRPFTHQQKECMLVSVAASPRPVYLNDEGREEFFVRTGNGTTSLKLSEAAAYIETRWGKK